MDASLYFTNTNTELRLHYPAGHPAYHPAHDQPLPIPPTCCQDRSEKETFKRRGKFMTMGLVVNSAGAFVGQLVSLFYGNTITAELGQDDFYLFSMR